MMISPGPPTKEELELLYPAFYTWDELKQVIATGDLGLLKRHPDMQKRYQLWAKDIRASDGSIVNYLVKMRLKWQNFNGCPPDVDPPYFTANISEQYVKVLPNDWPYRIPTEVEHHVVWSQLPVFHDDLIHPSVRAKIDYGGLYGFTGQEKPIAELLDPERELVKESGSHVHAFVLKTWPESLWECAWFVNPPRLQSVKSLSHIHVFARRK